MVRIVIILPCYNEEKSILHLHKKLLEIKLNPKFQIETLFINDCSKDETLSILEENKINHLNLPINLGIGGVVQTGLRYALNEKFDFAVQIDGDGQHPPSELEKIILELQKNESDLVIGSRYVGIDSFQSTRLRRFGIAYLSFIIYLITRQKIKDCTSGYRGFNRKAMALAAKHYPDEFPEPESIIYFTRNQLKIKEIPVFMKERENGESSIKGWKCIYYMIKVTISILFNYIKFKKNANY